MRFFTAVLAATFALASTPEALGTAQLLPFGEFAARDGRPGPGKTWKINDAQGEALAARMNATALLTPIVIDYEHQTLTAAEKGHKAPASGWMKSFEWLKGKGLFAKVDWTAPAAAHIQAKEYLYISPVITYDDAGNVTGVALAALVNYPAIVGMDPAMAAALSTFSAHFNEPEQESTVTLLAALIAGLGLKPEATEAEAITAVAALQAQIKAPVPVPAALATSLKLPATADMTAACSAVAALVATEASATTTIAALQGQIAQLTVGQNTTELGGMVDKAIQDGKLLPAMKDWALDLGRGNVTALKAYIEKAPVVVPGQMQSSGNEPRDEKTAALSAAQTEVFAKFGIPAADAKKYMEANKA